MTDHPAPTGSALTRWLDAEAGAPVADDRVDWLRVLPFFGLHVACCAALWVPFSWLAVAVCLGSYLIRMFAITAFYHRYFSHKAFRTGRLTQFCFAFLGASATQRGPLWWAAHHRAHHQHADSPDDPHGAQRGFWWSHLGWFLSSRHFTTDHQRVRDWDRFPELRWLNRFDVLAPALYAGALYALGELIGGLAPATAASGWQFLVWGYLISTVVLFHATFTINSLAHRLGTRRFDTRDASRNNRWLALLTLGEGWHNNHHRYAGSARQGFYPGEWDLSYRLLRVLAALGLVWDLREVPEPILAEGRS